MTYKIGMMTLLLGLAACATKEVEKEALNDKAAIQYQFAYDAYVNNDLIPALSSALQAVKISPGNADARNLLGLIYFRQGKYDEAEVELKKAVELDPNLSEAHNNLGTLYYDQKRYPDALRSLETALENPLYLYPERIYNNIGLTQAALGKTKEARASYERSIQLSRDFYLPYQNLGKLLMSEGETKVALNYLKMASELCPNCSEPRYHAGNILLKENKQQEALKLFKEGARIDPKGYYGQLCKQLIVE